MELDLRTSRRAFSRVGLGLSVFLLAATFFGGAWMYAARLIWGEDNWTQTTMAGMWLSNFLPMYLLACPLGLLIMKGVPHAAPESNKLSVKELLLYLLVSFPLMQGGALIGNLLSAIFSGGSAENPLNDFAMDTGPLKILFMVILAPLVEELVFRKVLLDRVSRYGERVAVLFSGLLFGLFHGNLFQFFYAFFLGCLLAVVYLRTGKLRYPVILHAIINFQGSVIAPWVLSFIDMDALLALTEGSFDPGILQQFADLIPGLLVYFGYSLILMGLNAWGTVVLVLRLIRFRWRSTELELPKGVRFKTAYLNFGVILLVVLCLGSCVLALFQ